MLSGAGNCAGYSKGWLSPDGPVYHAEEISKLDRNTRKERMRTTGPLLFAMLTVATLTSACTSPTEREAPSIPPPPNVDAPPPQAQRSSSGLAWIVLQPGKGTRYPRPNSEVTVHYTGWNTLGRSFDSSVARGEPATFALNEVIAGWTEGVQMMVEGEKRRFWIPASLAYGENPRGGAPAGMLVFDIELLKIDA